MIITVSDACGVHNVQCDMEVIREIFNYTSCNEFLPFMGLTTTQHLNLH